MSDGERMDSDLRRELHLLWGKERPLRLEDGSKAIQDLQSRYGLVLPEVFADYLRTAAPSTDWMDAGGIIWWAVPRIRSLRDECGNGTPAEQLNREIEEEASSYLVFADYLDWCYAYAICCSDGPNRGRIALIGVRPDRFVANSFTSFVRLAAGGSERLHSPTGDSLTDVA